MKARMILAAGTLTTLVGSSAFADEGGSSPTTATAKMSVQAQIELLPLGTASASAGGGTSISTDMALAYGVSAGLDYAVTPFLRIGVAPRLVFNVTSDQPGAGDTAEKEIDLRARLVGHTAVAPGLELYASLSPGYTIVLSGQDGVNNATGFAIGGAVGLTYDLSPKMFIGGEVGYQRAFTNTDVMLLGQTVSADLDVSYMHVGFGAGTRF